jgi:hypothetical protein
MGIRYATPPEQAAEFARAGLTELFRTAAMKTRGGVAVAVTPVEEERISLASAHPVYNVGLDDLTARRPLTEARLTGWRYLVDSDSATVASSEVSVDAAGRPTAFARVNEGPFVAATAQALVQIDQRPEVARGNYEIRLLKVPALYVVALWLKDLNSDSDLVVPLSPTPPYLVPGRTYAHTDFLELLVKPARQRLQFDDSPQIQRPDN